VKVLLTCEREANRVGVYGVGRVLRAWGVGGVAGAAGVGTVAAACHGGGDGVSGSAVDW
jgi:hypothetical protein